MKKGDKILCIKNLGTMFMFQKDNNYIIDETTTYDKISHSIYSEEENVSCVIINDDRLGRTAFTLTRYRDCFYFYDYFITLKEQRKQKLKNLL